MYYHFYCAHCHKDFWGTKCSHCGYPASNMQKELYALYQARHYGIDVSATPPREAASLPAAASTAVPPRSTTVSSHHPKEQSSWKLFKNMLLMVCTLFVVGMYFPSVFDSFVSTPTATPVPTPLIITTPTPSPPPTPMPPDAYINAGTVNMRTGPSTSHNVIRQYNYGDRLRIIFEMDGWYYVTIDGEWGYISKSLVSKGTPPARSTASYATSKPTKHPTPRPTAKPTPRPTEAPARSSSQNEETVYITRTGEKYHRSWCQHLRKSKIPVDLDDAIRRGYDACKVCW